MGFSFGFSSAFSFGFSSAFSLSFRRLRPHGGSLHTAACFLLQAARAQTNKAGPSRGLSLP